MAGRRRDDVCNWMMHPMNAGEPIILYTKHVRRSVEREAIRFPDGSHAVHAEGS